MIGKKIFELDRVDSTNAFANQLLLSGQTGDGDVVWAHEQYAGRGQHDHAWVSEAGLNLTLTVIFRPLFLAPDRQFLLNKVISLAVVDYLNTAIASVNETGQPGLSIKWPNDIYIGNLKIAGILIENRIMGSSVEVSMAGIGININQLSFSSEIPNPVSLIQVIHRETVLKEALLSLCHMIEQRYEALKANRTDSIDLQFDQLLLGFGKWRDFTCSDGKLEGKIKGVNQFGQLLLELRNGEVQEFNHREVEFLK